MIDWFLRRIEANWLLDENLIHSVVAGNKYRKVKAILEATGPVGGIVTIGSKYSSHLLASAYWARRLGVGMVGIVITDGEIEVDQYPHLKLARELGADLRWTDSTAAFDFIEETKAACPQSLWIPGGAHTPEAAATYERLMMHLLESEPALAGIEMVLLPLGTGTTALGIANGLARAGCKARVLGVSVSRSAERCREAMAEVDQGLGLDRIDIDDRFAGSYERRGEQTEAARSRFLDESGVLVDPIYNAKAFVVYYDRAMTRTLVINTGGMLNNLL